MKFSEEPERGGGVVRRWFGSGAGTEEGWRKLIGRLWLVIQN